MSNPVVCGVQARSKLYPRSCRLTRHIQTTNRSTDPPEKTEQAPAGRCCACFVRKALSQQQQQEHEQQHEQQHAAHMTACFYSCPPPPTMTMAGAPTMPHQPPPSLLEVVEEAVDLGAVVGTLRLRQLAPRSFNDACKSTAQGDATDCTGQRVYAGCQTMVRFLAGHSWLVRGRSVVELGCGVGACGLAVAGSLGAARVVLTDGQPSTLVLARANAEALGLLPQSHPHPRSQPQPQSQPRPQSIVSVRRLLFGLDGNEGGGGGGGDCDGGCRALLAEEGLDADGGADVVVGCELFYYNVDPAAVLATAAALVRRPAASAAAEGGGDGSGGGSGGVVLLAHIFRGAHLPQALADAAEVGSVCVMVDGWMDGWFGCRHVNRMLLVDRSTTQSTDQVFPPLHPSIYTHNDNYPGAGPVGAERPGGGSLIRGGPGERGGVLGQRQPPRLPAAAAGGE